MLSAFQVARTVCAKILWQRRKGSKVTGHNTRRLQGDPREVSWDGAGFAGPWRNVLRKYRQLAIQSPELTGTLKNMLATSRWW